MRCESTSVVTRSRVHTSSGYNGRNRPRRSIDSFAGLLMSSPEAWVTRATQRTLKHLREEIYAGELLARWSENTTVLPPSDADVRRVEELERAVVSGQISAAPTLRTPANAPAATMTLRLRVHASTAQDYRHRETIYLRHRGTALRSTSFLRFACELFIDTWRPRTADVEYAHIYQRDRHRCQRFVLYGFRCRIRLATRRSAESRPRRPRRNACTAAAHADRDLFVPRRGGHGLRPPRCHSASPPVSVARR